MKEDPLIPLTCFWVSDPVPLNAFIVKSLWNIYNLYRIFTHRKVNYCPGHIVDYTWAPPARGGVHQTHRWRSVGRRDGRKSRSVQERDLCDTAEQLYPGAARIQKAGINVLCLSTDFCHLGGREGGKMYFVELQLGQGSATEKTMISEPLVPFTERESVIHGSLESFPIIGIRIHGSTVPG